eukprot:TRINITY_DN10609_c0_g1_i1.p1 TRINITY_DN10609_c0_g1~~TRINITY_DN10609_c0_g1_i1.p1  ORF type:complete len:297 (+),score=28.46 TRINITY_DN10609_c0_g1_i1:106-891(+)
MLPQFPCSRSYAAWARRGDGARRRLLAQRLLALCWTATTTLLVLCCRQTALAFAHAEACMGSSCPVDVGEQPHMGQRLAAWLSFNARLPEAAIVVLLSALPALELRCSIPVGLWIGMPVWKVAALSIAGNMLPVPMLLFLLRSSSCESVMKPLAVRAQAHIESIDKHRRLLGVASFIGVPLPGTGVYTGAVLAHTLALKPQQTLLACLTGVSIAACIMVAITKAGCLGAAAVVAVGMFLLLRRCPSSQQSASANLASKVEP